MVRTCSNELELHTHHIREKVNFLVLYRYTKFSGRLLYAYLAYRCSYRCEVPCVRVFYATIKKLALVGLWLESNQL